MSSVQDAKAGVAEAFEAFGQQFLAQFGPLPSSKKRKANEIDPGPPKKRRRGLSPLQVGGSDSKHSDEVSSDSSGGLDDSPESNEGSETEEEEVGIKASHVPVVVFESDKVQKVASKPRDGFMSSRISKIRAPKAAFTSLMTKKEKVNEEEAQKNDRILYKLIHTKLLSASLDEHSDMTGAKRKKSLEGRILELATVAKLGKGEATVRKREHNKAPMQIRGGIISKRRERIRAKLEEAKDAGNYHPTIKRLLADPEEPKKRIKRARGIGMGVGKFRGGVLRLGKQEIQKGQNMPPVNVRGRGRSQGRSKT